MAARRLAISSLLCDGDNDRPQSREGDNYVLSSPLPAAAPPQFRQGDRHDTLPNSTPTAFATTSREVFYDGRRALVDDHRQPGRDAFGHQALTTPRFVPSRSITPLPLALQPADVRHRTPSPPPMSLPTSPDGLDEGEGEYFVEERRVPASAVQYAESFRDYPPNTVSQIAYATHTTTPYSQYSSPPSSSSGNAIDTAQGRPSLPVSSFRFSPPVPRRPLPVETSHGYVEQHTPMYQPGHPISPMERHPPAHPTMVHQSAGRAMGLSVNTMDTRYPHVGISPVQSRPPPSAGLSGLDALVQAATEERERIDEHRRLSGGSDRHHSVRDEHTLTSHVHSPISAGGSRTHRLSPEFRARPLESQGHLHTFADTSVTEQPRTIYNYAAQDARSSKRRKSTPTLSPADSDAKSTLTNAIHRSQQVSPHGYTHTRTPTSPVNVGRNLVPREYMDPMMTDSRVAAGIEELSLARSLPNRSQPSPVQVQYQSEDELFPRQRRASGPSLPGSSLGHSHGRRTPPRSKPKTKPGSAALHNVEKQAPRQAAPEPSTLDHHKPTHSDRKSQKHDLQKEKKREEEEDVRAARVSKPHPPSKRADVNRPRKDEVGERNKRDTDVDEFFLSVYDSPRQEANRQVQPEDSSLDPHKHVRDHRGLSGHSSVAHAPKTHKNLRPESDMDDEFANAVRGSSLDEPTDEGDFEEDLAEAIANSEYESGDERDVPSDFADAMDVDVEDELLSLVEPAQSDVMNTSQEIPDHHPLPSSSSREAIVRRQGHGHLSPESRDRLSMPPPTTTKSGKVGKAPKADTGSKDTATAKASGSNKEVKSSKKSAPKTDDALSKMAKAKQAPKPKPKASSEKLKSGKQATEAVSAELSNTAAIASVTAPSPGPGPAEDPFPVVTSSGRMVKKSIASTLAAQSAASTSKKKAVAVSSTANADGSNSRSRSHSVMPRASVDPEPEKDKTPKIDEERAKDDEEAGDEDDKLYCICRTRYDEDRVMIACDRCDEWYHTQCVKMPDLHVDLVDQFICPTCVKRNHGLHLKTTYKPRCFAGLKHSKPNSADACHKPARGAYSKYCSDECGVKYMHTKLQTWANKGGDVERLWESVKAAKRREGVVVAEPGRTLPKKILAELSNVTPPNLTSNVEEIPPDAQMNIDQPTFGESQENGIVAPNPVAKLKIASLEAQLGKIVSEREERKKEMEVVEWRQRLLSLAIRRAEVVGECGWDQRLCFGDEEWREFGEGVLESYEEASEGMEVDEQEGVWWCRGEKKCERHAGWQKLRDKELSNEREERDDVLVQLTTREREIRNRMEDILHSKPQGNTATMPKLPLMSHSLNVMNGKDEEVKKKKKKSGR
ncbi:hypothetical protein SCHPADRAFT_939500 [Schizopora paradoxa]|uniref:PHD-type domain-containing protein n=1 Tax=Schizopora paradoxa TaxID=27342 RepID=A0A0H2RRH1_9AGAM|nr:hypothetical protein SCHPADRAFT_939500 [Schizopora paradoxa]